MPNSKMRHIAAFTLATMTWTTLVSAQQSPGTNVPTPLPASESASSASTAPLLNEPVIDMKTESSSLPNTPLLVTGLVVLGGSYGATAVAAGLSDRDDDEKLYYPVVGPWMALDERDCALQSCDDETLDKTLLIGSGVLQGLGALSMVLSLVIPSTSTREWYLIGNEDVVVAPLMGAGELGATAVGRF